MSVLLPSALAPFQPARGVPKSSLTLSGLTAASGSVLPRGIRGSFVVLAQLFAPAVVIDVRTKVADNADYQLTPDDITAWEQVHGRIPANAVVLMYTGWDTRWSDYDKHKNADANRALRSDRGLKAPECDSV